jgi:hypothetical protein
MGVHFSVFGTLEIFACPSLNFKLWGFLLGPEGIKICSPYFESGAEVDFCFEAIRKIRSLNNS